MIKDLNDKIFKYHIYTKYYNAILDFTQRLRFKKTSNIIFNKKLTIYFEEIFDIKR